MAQTLELETLVTRLVGDDSDYQKVLKHAEAATGVTAGQIESKLTEIQKALDDLGKVDLKDLENSMVSLAEKTIAFRNELKIDEIHNYIEMLESVKKKQDSLSLFKDKTASSSAGVETLFTGGNKSLSSFTNATTSKNPFSAFTKELPQAKSSLDAFNNSLGKKSVSSLDAWTNATSKATSQFSAFKDETSKSSSLDAWNKATAKTTDEVKKFGGVLDSTIKIGQVFKFAVGFTMVQAAHKLAEELVKDVVGINAFNKSLEESAKLAQKLDYIRNRAQSRRQSEINAMDFPERKLALQAELPKAQDSLALAQMEKQRAQKEMDTFEGFEGDELLGTPQWQAAKKALEDAEKALADAQKNVDGLKDSITEMDRAAKNSGEGVLRDLNLQLEILKNPHNAGLLQDIDALNEMVRTGRIAADQWAEINKKMEEVREGNKKRDIENRMFDFKSQKEAVKADKNQRDQQLVEGAALRRQLQLDPQGFGEEEIRKMMLAFYEIKEAEEDIQKKHFFESLKEEAEGLSAELKHVPRDIIDMENELKRLAETGIYSPEELSNAKELMKKKIQMQRQLADRRAGDPNRLGIQGVEARGAEAFAKLRGQFNSDKTPLDSIASNIEKQVTILEEIRDKNPFGGEGFAAAGLN